LIPEIGYEWVKMMDYDVIVVGGGPVVQWLHGPVQKKDLKFSFWKKNKYHAIKPVEVLFPRKHCRS
jgi:ribulose 1,5-bisphosphate synthetase/thiazole synthase